MLLDEVAAPFASDVERARADSLTLWQSLIVLPDDAYAPGGPPLVPVVANHSVLDLPARCFFGDGRESDAEIAGISPHGLRVRGAGGARPGIRCVANVARIGMVEGVVVEANADSFILGLIAPPRRLRRLARRLNWQIRRINNDEIVEKRSSERIEMNYASATIATADGKSHACGLLDLSREGAGLHIGPLAIHFWIGQPVKLDGRPGQVVRTFPEGFAVRFS